MSGPRRASRPHESADSEGPVRPRGTAKDRALRLLGVRDRSRRELQQRLIRAGFEPEEIDSALDELASAGLIDDERFAGAIVEHAATGRPSGRRAVLTDLLIKGVDRVTAEQAVARLEEGEEERAVELAQSRAARLRDLDPAAAYRRLFGFLVRRGFGPDVARSATQRALGEPPED